jgi:hypothetical protein
MKKLEFYKLSRKELLRLLDLGIKINVREAMHLPTKSDICFQFYMSEDILLGKKVGDIQRIIRNQTIQKMNHLNTQQKLFKAQNLEAIKKRGSRSVEKNITRSKSLTKILKSVFCGLSSAKKVHDENASPLQRKKIRHLSKQKFMVDDIRNNTV